ncbi:MAG: transcription-repair coupling factor [Phycisphaerae bacterium]|nr:transcription-repair coupling factor [Phycisphaerae bacterium]
MIVSNTITEDVTVKALCARLAAERIPLGATGLWGSAAPILAALVSARLDRPLLFVTAHLDQADDARDDMETVLGRAVGLLPAWEALPGEGSGAGEIRAERTRLCAALAAAADPSGSSPQPPSRTHQSSIASPQLVAPVQALMQPVPSPACLDANSLTLAVGQQREPEQIATFLSDRGFERLDQVERPGDFALRGGILDIFATADSDPVRVEFFGNEIESIRQFEVGSQRSMRNLEMTRITLSPDPTTSQAKDTTSFLNYLPEDTLVVLEEPVEIAEIARTVLDRLGNPVGHYPIEAIQRRLAAFGQLHVSRFPTATVPDADAMALQCEALPSFEAKTTDAVQQLVSLGRDHPVVVYCDNKGEEDRLAELVAQVLDEATRAGAKRAAPPDIETCIGLIHRGFTWKTNTVQSSAADRQSFHAEAQRAQRFCHSQSAGRDAQSLVAHHQASVLTILPHHELFRRYTQKRRIRKVTTGRPIESFLDLSDGDYVVHVVHGIARYVGMRTMTKGDSRKSEEFLTLRFADGATIHVPVSQIDLVQKYVGAKAMRPPLSKLGGTRWQSTKARVEEAVTDLAGELLRVQAARQAEAGVAFPRDTHWQTEFENAFLYTETPDQASAAGDIKTDMTRQRPMDRLLCGDVGYGKTELAMRAAFKAVEFGKQVAVLVPTTVLAEQHYRTFAERMADYPFIIERLNRFRSAKEQREIVAAAKKGQIDILIGTHRILSKDVGFADLGLVIVDEEQRFGVEHKEHLKCLRTTVDVLTLTATPIPRTLHMAMVGLRDISSLATPPLDRRAISTRVCTWSDGLIRSAIIRELNRDGQVYFVHNRVRPIRNIANNIASLVPEARVIVGHGQMPGDELEGVMLRFVRHEADVLVCTTIIEAGLDIPNVNTIFIDRADMFGLADLHQLRGRVGRYKHRAHCYLLLSPDRPLTGPAAKRLKAVEEFSELGAGFRIAMRDLEIRGAGNILGPEQSGHIAAVGYELYCQMLEKAVKRMRGEAYSERPSVHLELDVEAHIPRSYIPSDRQRMECYRRFAACRSAEEADQLGKDLQDAFGHYPATVETLLTLTEVKVRAAQWNIKTIIKKEPDLIFSIEGEVKKIEPLFAGSGGSVRVPDGRTMHWRLPEHYFHGQTLLRILVNLFRRESTGIDGADREPSEAATSRSKGRPPSRSGPVVVSRNVRPADGPRRRKAGGSRRPPRRP